MSRLAAVLTTVLALCLGVPNPAHAAPASACVTPTEWAHLRAVPYTSERVTLHQLDKYLDGAGTPGPGTTRHYALCGHPWDKARVVIAREAGHVTGAYKVIVGAGTLS